MQQQLHDHTPISTTSQRTTTILVIVALVGVAIIFLMQIMIVLQQIRLNSTQVQQNVDRMSADKSPYQCGFDESLLPRVQLHRADVGRWDYASSSTNFTVAKSLTIKLDRPSSLVMNSYGHAYAYNGGILDVVFRIDGKIVDGSGRFDTEGPVAGHFYGMGITHIPQWHPVAVSANGDVDRGTHTIDLMIRNRNGQNVVTYNGVSFTVLSIPNTLF